MVAQCYQFAEFELEPAQRQLRCAGVPVELNSRYLDALQLLLQNAGKLVSKQQFFEQVWPGLVVSDEALTQCIRTLRRVLQDSASAPRFIETVPKHGYRFIAAVSWQSAADSSASLLAEQVPVKKDVVASLQFWQHLAQGLAGAAIAGLFGGAVYGLLAAAQLSFAGREAIALGLVLLSITLLLALLAGGAVAAALSAAMVWGQARAAVILLSGVSGGLLVGSFVSLLLHEVLQLFFGRSPAQITGAGEGAAIGLATALSCLLLLRFPGKWHALLIALILSQNGGVLLAGSLVQLAAQFPDAALATVASEALLRNQGHNGWVHLSAMLEAALFCAGVSLALSRSWLGVKQRNL
ncbi:MAG: CadC family transcriptional regulator [Alishewanella sp. 34-51-39]|nr:MAG: CadC family transcriptional regulator [Alishewanella sp. 34-51-39]